MNGKPVDNLWTTRRQSAQLIHMLATYLTSSVRSILAGERLKPIARMRSLVLLGALCVVSTTPAEANQKIDQYKLYAHSRVINYEQFICLSKIIYKESRWNPLAKNGSHNGIPQGRSEYLARVDGYKQVEWGLSYIHNHGIYQGDTCKAWQHWKDYNWH